MKSQTNVARTVVIRNCKLYIPVLLLIVLMLGSCNNTSGTETVDDLPPVEGVVFPNTEYSKVVAYHFEDLEGNAIISKQGELNPTVKKEKILTQDEIDAFLAAINNDNTYGGVYTRCFKPRLGVVFYDDANKAVAHISICFECSQQHAVPIIKAYTNAPIGNHGYSEEGYRTLTRFCQKLGFGQCGE